LGCFSITNLALKYQEFRSAGAWRGLVVMPDGDDPFLRLNRDGLALAVARLQGGPCEHAIPVVRAVARGEIVLALMPRHSPDLSLSALKRAGLPALVIAQDDDFADTGPAGFPPARKALRWAAAAIIHATGGKPEHYAQAVEVAKRHGSCVLVETSSARAAEWAALAQRATLPRRARVLTLLPTEGAHPVMPARECMH